MVHCGAGSRRECQKILVEDRISVNGELENRPSLEIIPGKDEIRLDTKILKPGEKEYYYILMNKPLNVICSHKDPAGRNSVYDLLHHKYLSKAGLFSIGRLDYRTSGLIFLTNDGDFAQILAHPKTRVVKTYIVKLKGIPDEQVLKMLNRGVRMGRSKSGKGGELLKCHSAEVIGRGPKDCALKIELTEGKNREIRRLMAFFKLKIKSLQRIRIGNFTLKGINEGDYRLVKKSDIQKFLKSIKIKTGK